MSGMRLDRYMPFVGGNNMSGVGAGLGELGKGIASLGHLATAEEERKRKAELETKQFELDKLRTESQVNANNANLDFTKLQMSQAQKAVEDKALERSAYIKLFRERYPEATKNFTDDELGAFGDKFEKYTQTTPDSKFLKAWTDADGNMVGTFQVGNQIYSEVFGPADTKGGTNKKIPPNYMEVSQAFFDDFAHVPKSEARIIDERYYFPIEFVQKKSGGLDERVTTNNPRNPLYSQYLNSNDPNIGKLNDWANKKTSESSDIKK